MRSRSMPIRPIWYTRPYWFARDWSITNRMRFGLRGVGASIVHRHRIVPRVRVPRAEADELRGYSEGDSRAVQPVGLDHELAGGHHVGDLLLQPLGQQRAPVGVDRRVVVSEALPRDLQQLTALLDQLREALSSHHGCTPSFAS